MAKFNLGLTGLSDAGVAEGREAWSGELPPSGVYHGVLKVISIGEIQSNENGNKGKTKFNIGVELRNKPYDGFIAWGSLSLIEASKPFINQFLLSLTDGSDAQFAAIQKAFENNIVTDERKKHVEKIGKWAVNSPKGELPIKVSLLKSSYYNEVTKQSNESTRIDSFLINENAPKVGGGEPELPVEEEAVVDLEVEDEDAIEDDVDSTDDESLLDA